MKKLSPILLIILLVVISFSTSAQLDKVYFIEHSKTLIDQNKYTEAIKYLNILIESDPNNRIETDSTMAKGWLLRGEAKFYLNDFYGALLDINNSILKNPLSSDAYRFRAIVKNSLLKFNDALTDLEFALELRPEDANILFTRGGTYIQLKQYNKAIQDYTKIIRFYPKSIDTWINRSIAKICLTDTIGAINDISHAIKLNPFYSDSYSRRSRLYFETKEYDIALSDISKAIYLDSTSTINYFIRGLIQNARRKYSAAITDFDKILSIDPKNSLSLYNRALIKSNTGALNSALDDYDILARLNPNNVLVFFNRAGVNFELGKFQNAISDYSRAIELFPDFANAYFNRSAAKSRIGNNVSAEEDYEIAKSKVQKYKTSSKEAYFAMADTSKKFNNLLEFDTDFGNGFTNINLKNKIELPTGFLPFIKLQVVDENSRSIFKDFKTPFIDELNKAVQKGFQFTFSSNNSNTLKFSIDTSASPKSVAFFIKASQLSLQNKYSQSIKEYEKAFKYEPNNLIIAFNLYTERVEMAKFVDQFNTDANAVSFKMGNRNESKDNQSKSTNYLYNEAIDIYKGIELTLPDLAAISYNIGCTYILTEEMELASNEFTKAISIDPRFAEAWFNRGLIKLIKGEKLSGCNDISKAGELGQNQAYSLIQKFCK